jgi:CcmD family protein
MSEGVIVGGWSYVIAASTITGVGLAVYIWSLIARLRRAHEREED